MDVLTVLKIYDYFKVNGSLPSFSDSERRGLLVALINDGDAILGLFDNLNDKAEVGKAISAAKWLMGLTYRDGTPVNKAELDRVHLELVQMRGY